MIYFYINLMNSGFRNKLFEAELMMLEMSYFAFNEQKKP